jgi:hypothetical protein
VVLDLGVRAVGAAPEVSTVRGASVWLPSGETVKLPSGLFGSITEYGPDLAWLTRTGGEVRLNVSDERLPSATNGREVTGAEPGPNGSVIVRTKAGPVFLTSGGKLIASSQPELRTNRMVATADAIWVEKGGQVSRVQMTDLERGASKGKSYPQFKKVVVGDPRADRLVVIDDLGCQAVVKGSTAEWVWRSCDWELSAFSSDGGHVAGRSVMYGTIGVIDLTRGELVLGIDPDVTPVGPQMAFDEADRLNFRVGNRPVNFRPQNETEGFAFMACNLAGTCWLSSDRYPDPIDFVLPNRR